VIINSPGIASHQVVILSGAAAARRAAAAESKDPFIYRNAR